MKSLDVKSIPILIGKLFRRLQTYASVIAIVFFVGIFSFLVYRINVLTNNEPSDDDVTAGLQTLKRPRIDQSVIDKLEQLEDTNVQVKTLFQQARDNPFQE